MTGLGGDFGVQSFGDVWSHHRVETSLLRGGNRADESMVEGEILQLEHLNVTLEGRAVQLSSQLQSIGDISAVQTFDVGIDGVDQLFVLVEPDQGDTLVVLEDRHEDGLGLEKLVGRLLAEDVSDVRTRMNENLSSAHPTFEGHFSSKDKQTFERAMKFDTYRFSPPQILIPSSYIPNSSKYSRSMA